MKGRLLKLASITFIFLLGFMWITGLIPRSMDGIMPDANVEFCGRVTSAEAIADKFIPKIMLYSDYDITQISISYEMIALSPNNLLIVYRIIFPDEIHPNFVIDFLYRIYRSVWYGTSKDIEPIAVYIDSKTGGIEYITFEKPVFVNSNLVKHELVEINASDHDFTSGIYLKVISWNHLFEISSITDEQFEEADSHYLDNYDYCLWHITRRSDLGTIKSKMIFHFGIIQIVFVLLYLFIVILLLTKKNIDPTLPSNDNLKDNKPCPNCNNQITYSIPLDYREAFFIPFSRGDSKYMDGQWRKLSNTMYKIPFWNSRIGVTRYFKRKDICHSVIKCPSCNLDFDCFCTKGDNLENLWSHLYSRKPENSKVIFERFLFGSKFKTMLLAIFVFLYCGFVGMGYQNNDAMNLHIVSSFIGILWAYITIYLLMRLRDFTTSHSIDHNIIATVDAKQGEIWRNYFNTALFGYSDKKKHWHSPAILPAFISSAVIILYWFIWQKDKVPGLFTIMELILWIFVSFVEGYAIWISLNVGISRINLLTKVKLKVTPLNAYQAIDSIFELAEKNLAVSACTMILPILLLSFGKIFPQNDAHIFGWLSNWFSWVVILVLLVISRFIRPYATISIFMCILLFCKDLIQEAFKFDIYLVLISLVLVSLLFQQWRIVIKIVNESTKKAEEHFIHTVIRRSLNYHLSSPLFNPVDGLESEVSDYEALKINEKLKNLRPQKLYSQIAAEFLSPFFVAISVEVLLRILH